MLSAYEGCHVPEVIAARSTRRVLTTALVQDARSFCAFVTEAPQALLDSAAERIFVSAFESIFRHCAFNTDPHPGNYLFHDDGSVTFLDYGCVRRFEPEFIDPLPAACKTATACAFERPCEIWVWSVTRSASTGTPAAIDAPTAPAY